MNNSNETPLTTVKFQLNRINLFLLSMVCSFLLSYCSKEELNDYRENYSGRYGGIQVTGYYFLDPLDTSLTASVQDTLHAEVLVTLAECEDCISILYTTPDDGMITDTVNLTEDGIFESTFRLIGDTYYRYYNVYFEDDSLLIEFDWRSSNEMHSFEFKGKKLASR